MVPIYKYGHIITKRGLGAMSILFTSIGHAPDFIVPMKIRIFFSLLLISFLTGIFSCGGSSDYSETYIILINQERVGKEIITEKTDRTGNLVCISEQEMDSSGSKGKKRRIIRTKTVFSKGIFFPVSYSYESSSGISYDIKVEGGKIIKTLKNKGESSETITSLKSDMLMLDLTVFHTINYWIRKFDENKRGQQVFQTYLPATASIERLSVVSDGVIIPEHDSQLKNYEIKIGNELTMLLWMDKDNRLYRMFIKGPNIDVIRSDLFDRLNKNKSGKK